jgi:hypothetical protein
MLKNLEQERQGYCFVFFLPHWNMMSGGSRMTSEATFNIGHFCFASSHSYWNNENKIISFTAVPY